MKTWHNALILVIAALFRITFRLTAGSSFPNALMGIKHIFSLPL
jgi:hypothetical protein